MSKTASSQRTPGRPREFDMDVVLDKAITVFSRLGYSATNVVFCLLPFLYAWAACRP